MNLLPFLFARRYFNSAKSVHAINIIAWVSVVAIAVVTAALTVVFSVFNGFEGLVKSLYSDFYADIRIQSANGKTIRLSAVQINQIKGVSGVQDVSLIAEEKALLVHGNNQTVAYLKGVDEHFSSIVPLQKNGHIVRGSFQIGNAQNPALCLGIGIESALEVDVERGLEPVTVYLPGKSSGKTTTLEEALVSYNAQPSGTFMVQQEFDSKYVFSNLSFVKYMLSMNDDEYSATEIKLQNQVSADVLATQLQQLLGSAYSVQTRYRQNQSLYRTMQTEKWVIFAITCLILSIASFNIIGALTMLVLEKKTDIALLLAIGAPVNMVRRIFLAEGLFLSFVGLISGFCIGTLICLIQIKWHLVKLQGGSFIIDYYPVSLLWSDYLVTATAVFIIALVAAYFPGRKIVDNKILLRS